MAADTLRKHEIFEITLLNTLKSGRFLDPLVFGGGTMLRLCHELNRYSSDLDFWFIKETDQRAYFARLKKYLGERYEVTDAAIKFYTLLFELRDKDYPRRLKIEIRKKAGACEYEDRIAFSPYATQQVVVRTYTLSQMMKNKIEAAIDRKNIRDCFDIEFLLRRGVPLICTPQQREGLKRLLGDLKERDYSVTLGVLLEPKERAYYRKQKFSYLKEKLTMAGR